MAIVRWKMADLMPPEVYAIVARRRELDEARRAWPTTEDEWWDLLTDHRGESDDDEELIDMGTVIIAWLRWRGTVREVAAGETSE